MDRPAAPPGRLALTLERAALFVDSRYWVQAEREIAGSGIELVKTPSPAATFHIDWLCRQVPEGGTVEVMVLERRLS